LCTVTRTAIADIQFNRYAEPLGIYAEGFLDSAAAIFERAEESRRLVDFAFYPGAYCATTWYVYEPPSGVGFTVDRV